VAEELGNIHPEGHAILQGSHSADGPTDAESSRMAGAATGITILTNAHASK